MKTYIWRAPVRAGRIDNVETINTSPAVYHLTLETGVLFAYKPDPDLISADPLAVTVPSKGDYLVIDKYGQTFIFRKEFLANCTECEVSNNTGPFYLAVFDTIIQSFRDVRRISLSPAHPHGTHRLMMVLADGTRIISVDDFTRAEGQLHLSNLHEQMIAALKSELATVI